MANDRAKIRGFIFELKGWDKNSHAEIDENTQLLAEGIIGSVNVLQIISFLEETYRVIVSEDDLVQENFASIEAIHELLIGLQKRTQNTP